MSDDYDVDDVLGDYNPKKRKNSKDKGKRGELQLCKLLNSYFKTQEFSRVVGSGNRWSHIQYVSKDYIGDLVCPANFKFCIECKFGYPEITLQNILSQKCKTLDSFLKQAEDDAERSKKYPLLCWKQDRQPWICFFKNIHITSDVSFISCLNYKSWIGVELDEILKLNESTFIE